MWTKFGNMFKTAIIGAGLLLAGQAANAAIITFNQTNVNVTEGDLFALTLVGQDFTAGVGGATANGTLGGGVTLSWNPTVLTLPSFTAANIVFPGDQFFGSTVPILLDNTAGTLSFSVASFFGTNLTAFNIAVLNFTALAAGATTVDIVVSTTDVWADGVGAVDVHPTAIDGAVSVTAVPLPASVMLLAMGLLGLIAVGRSRDFDANVRE